ncbi:MAG: C1 family peptidase [Bacteroidota bacterium]
MKKIFLLLALCAFIVKASGQQISLAPVNPEFTDYINTAVKVPAITSEGFALGELPSPHNYFFSSQPVNKINPDFDPVYDLRTAGSGGTSLLTPVKNQGSCGSCWTFATCASMESRWFITGYGTFDLSENNLKECHNFDYASCDGGNIDMSTAYLSRRSGPVSESDDPYSAVDGSCTGGLTPVAYVTDARFLPNDMASIKQAILDYGAIYSNMYYSDTYYNSSDKTYYYSGSSGTNHGITLAGWDDNKVTAGGTGAWIIKNSWGISWGESGFFYISYNDTKVNTSVGFFPLRTDYDAQSEIYYYDDFGDIGTFGYGSNIAYGLVKFTATSDQMIKKIGTYAEASNAVIGAEIYDNFIGGILSGLLGSVSSQTCTLPGYYSFDLFPISISSGNDFYIKVYYNTPGYNYPVPLEYAVGGYSSAAVVETGKCWSSGSGSSWTALGQGTSYVYDVCVKVYAENILAPAIVTHPSASTLCSGGNTNFSVTASGSSLTYQWQLSTNGGSIWSDLSNVSPYSNVTTDTMAITNATTGMNLYLYRCIVSNTYGDTPSNAAILTVNETPAIVSNPSDSTICAGANASFDVSASGTSPSYQWQLSTNGGSVWTNLTNTPPYSNVTTNVLNITSATIDMNTYRYRCPVNINTCSAISDNAVLNVNPVPQPELGNDTMLCAGDYITLDPGSGFDDYEWSTGETSGSINVDSTGTGFGLVTIYLTVTSNSCANSDTVDILFDDCTGIHLAEIITGVNIYPNPSDNIINITVNNPEKGTIISFSDIHGKEIKRYVTDKKNNKIDVSELSAGIFFICIKNTDVSFSDKILIVRKKSD